MRKRNEEQSFNEYDQKTGGRGKEIFNRGREMIDRGIDRLGRNLGSDNGRQRQFRFNQGREDRWSRPGDFERYDRERPFQDRYRQTPREDIGYNADYSAMGGFESERSGHYGKGPKGWKRSSERIKEDVCEALWRSPGVDASDIDVRVEGNTVILEGTVRDRGEKREAENCVENLSGVEDVRNELRVKRELSGIEMGRKESNLRDEGSTTNLS